MNDFQQMKKIDVNAYPELLSELIRYESEDPDLFLQHTFRKIASYSGNRTGYIFQYDRLSENLSILPAFMEINDNLNKMYSESLYNNIYKDIVRNRQEGLDFTFSSAESGNYCFFLFSVSDEMAFYAAFSGRSFKYHTEEINLLKNLVSCVWSVYKTNKLVTTLKNENTSIASVLKLKSEYMMNTAHQIRTPLNAITGFSGLLSETKQLLGEESKYLEIIHESAEELLESINKFDEFANFDQNCRKLNVTSIDTQGLINEVLDNYIPKAFINNIEICNNSPSLKYSEPIYSDVLKLNQIFNTMISISLKHLLRGKIEVFGNYEGKFLRIEISGKGDIIAIPGDADIAIWNNSLQINNDLIPVSIAEISCIYLKLLGGRSGFACEKNEFTFWIEVPSIENNKNKLHNGSRNIPNGIIPGKRILVAEDDDNNYLLIMNYLDKSGFELTRARDGQEAVDLCKNTDFDLVFMDLKMPVLDGFSAIQLILENKPGMKIIIQSAFLGDSEKVFESGCTDFIAKPFRKQQLLSMVNSYI